MESRTKPWLFRRRSEADDRDVSARPLTATRTERCGTEGTHSPAPSEKCLTGFPVSSSHSDRVLHATESAPTPGDLINEWRPWRPVLLTPADSRVEIRPSSSSSFPPAFYFSQHYCLFRGTLPPRDTPERDSVVISASSEVSGVICSGTHEFLFA